MTDDASYIDDDEIVENVVDCPGCNEPCGHEILKEKPVKAGVNYLLKCDECGHVHNYQLREPKPITIPFLLSEGANTVTVKIELDDDEILSIGDIFEYSDASWEINRIENEENISVSNLISSKVSRANAVRSDVVMVRLTLTMGEYSESDSIFVDRDTVYKAGSIFDYDGVKWKIRAIHTGAGRTMTGSVVAHDIKRMYLHEPPKPEEFAPRTSRERRQAWKEGKLGFNPNPIIPDAEKKGKPKPGKQGRRKKKKRS
ncbi:MAG: HVO_0476 family zinc finger protein [Euryarchaeota archaeon]